MAPLSSLAEPGSADARLTTEQLIVKRFIESGGLKRLDGTEREPLDPEMMDDFNSETDSEYTSYWRDWVGAYFLLYDLFSFGVGIVLRFKPPA